MEKDCLFCKIINGDVNSKKVYEDDMVVAFHDINPVAPVHVLVIPKIHINGINEIDEGNIKYISRIWQVIPKVAFECGLSEDGYRVICNCGENGGQVINHIHFHVIGGKKLGAKIVNE